MRTLYWHNVGAFITQYAKEYGDRAGRDLVHLLGKFVKHSCNEYCLDAGTHKMPYLSKKQKAEIHKLHGDIATCRDCDRKVNYCCRIHQTAVEYLHGENSED